MVKLEYARKDVQGPVSPAERYENSHKSRGVFRRTFEKYFVAPLVGVGLAFGVPAAMTASRTASAQTIVIQGLSLETMYLADTVANLDRQTEPYRQEMGGERTPSRGDYSNAVVLPRELTGTAIFSADGKKSFGVLYLHNGEQRGWEADISAFAELVRNMTGQELTRVKLIVERTTDTTRGDQILSVYMLPIDSQGNYIATYSGGYLAVGASVYPQRDTVYGGAALLLEPGTPEPSVVSRR